MLSASSKSPLLKLPHQAFLVLIALAALPPGAFAQNKSRPSRAEQGASAGDAQARQAVQGVYDRQSAALTRRDVNGFLALCAPDYKDVKRDAKTGKKQVFPAGYIRQTLPHRIAAYTDFLMTATIETFRRRGDRAEVTATRHVTLTLTDPRAKKKRPYRSDTRTRDAWIKTPAGWRTRSSEEIAYQRL